MKNYGVIFFIVVASKMALASTCTSSSSCWTAINNTLVPASIQCSGYGKEKFFYKENLNDEVYEKQYDIGFGDGLGYPEPGVSFDCTFSLPSGKKALLSFRTINWGDQITFTLEEGFVKLTQAEFWGNKTNELTACYH